MEGEHAEGRHDRVVVPLHPGRTTTEGICRRCAAPGVLDYLDLVQQRAKYHCLACELCWDESLSDDPAMGTPEMVRFRQQADARRHRR